MDAEKQAAARGEDEARFRAVVEQVRDAVFVRTGMEFAYLNPAAVELFGAKSAAELVGQPVMERFGEEARERVRERIRHVDERREAVVPLELDYVRLDGTRVAVEASAAPITYGGRAGAVVMARDIRERKQLEAALRASEERLRKFARHARCILWSGPVEGLPGWEDEARDFEARFRWPGSFLDEAAAQEFLPLEVGPGRTYAEAWRASRDPAADRAMKQVTARALTRGAGAYANDFQCTDRHGGVHWLREEVVLQAVAYGRWYAYGVVTDITERKRAEEALRESEERFRTLVEHAPEGIFVQSGGRFVYLNASMLNLLGAGRPEDLVGREFMERMAPEYHEAIRERIRRQSAVPGPVPPMEQEYIRLDGVRVPVETTGVGIRYQGREAHLVFVRDITGRKRTQAALRASEARFRTLIEDAPVAIGIGRDGLTLYVNRAYLELFGLGSLQDVVGRPLAEHWAPEWQALVDERARQRSQGLPVAPRYEATAQRRNGAQFPAEVAVTAVELPDGPATLAFITDLTERKQAEEAWRREKALSDAVINGLPGVFYMFDRAGRLVRWNEEYLRVTGVAPEAALGQVILQRIAEEDRAAVAAAVERIFAEGSATVEATVVREDGRRTPFHLAGRRLDAGGQSWLVGMGYDISEQKRAEEILRRYELLAQNTRDVILFVRVADRRIVEANAAAVTAYGYSREELAGMTIGEVRSPETRDWGEEQIEQAFERGIRFETVHRRKDGSLFPVEVSSQGTMLGAERVVMSIVRDISERRRAEEAARQQQAQVAHLSRVMAVGEMASGLAHELNQPMGAILNYATVAADAVAQGDLRTELLHKALVGLAGEAKRAGEIIGRLRAFVRKQPMARQPADMVGVLREGLALLEYELRRAQVQPREEYAAGLPRVALDAVQIQQVVVNLVRNALEAMAETPAGERRLTVRAVLEEGARVRVEVEDTGSGLAEEVRGRVFEPFVTSKVHGLGLGLAVSRSIIESHGGSLEVRSNTGRGMTFYFTLPVM